jgi:hypothetical protein
MSVEFLAVGAASGCEKTNLAPVMAAHKGYGIGEARMFLRYPAV